MGWSKGIYGISSSEGFWRKRDRERVSKALGRKLKSYEVVHHHTDGTLVLCEDQAFHKLIHQRMNALKACGHADWRKCYRCKEYDSLDNLCTGKNGVYHSECARKHMQQIRLLRNLQYTSV